jgi:predicted transcriptional regulator
MLGRTDIKTDYRNIFGNETRIKIWDLCKKKPRSFTELKKELNLASGTLHHHIDLMKKANLLKVEEIKEGDKFRRGKKTTIIPNIEEFNRLFDEEQKRARKHFHSKFPDELKAEVLNILKENQPISKWDFNKILIEKGYSWEISWEIETFLITNLILDSKIDEIYNISKEGEKFVEEQERKSKLKEDIRAKMKEIAGENDLKTTKTKEKETNKSGNTTQKEQTATKGGNK